MKYASIDIGTNSVRLLLTEIENGQIIESSKKLNMTRIGKGVDASKELARDRMQATADAIEIFAREAKQYGAEDIYIMATSAVRDAANRDDFIKLVKTQTSYDVVILSGEMEAKAGFLGVLKGLEQTPDKILVIDIGGGSTELIVGDTGGISFSISLDMGAVRLTDRHLKGELYTLEEVEALKKDVMATLQDYLIQIKEHDPQLAIGIGGTATTYCTIIHAIAKYKREAVHNQKISLAEIKKWNMRLLEMTHEEKLKVTGLSPKRADIICAGGLILEMVLETLGFDQLQISDYDNLEGYLFHEIEA